MKQNQQTISLWVIGIQFGILIEESAWAFTRIRAQGCFEYKTIPSADKKGPPFCGSPD